MNDTRCLDAETMAAWLDGGLDEAARADAETHTADCARCQAMLAALTRLSDAAEPARAATPAAMAPRPTLHRWLIPIATAAGIGLTVVLLPDRSAIPPSPVAGDVARERDIDLARPELERRDTPATPAPAATAPPAATRVAEPAPAAQTAERAVMDAVTSALVGPIDIATPDPAVRWRVTGDAVERSTDTGASWTAVPIEAGAVITAGSAPSATTCWLVGRGGTVLVTTDARTWRRLPFPEAGDLVAVTARDARTASVTTADGRTFETATAGETWTPRRPLQEN
ncbi:MAG TPA: zf-HC2 domain-containing protein [Vicinamibacterales bacterium]|nr:zf-HC2 domain-containing protein [Vicinamibacterales bacterium]